MKNKRPISRMDIKEALMFSFWVIVSCVVVGFILIRSVVHSQSFKKYIREEISSLLDTKFAKLEIDDISPTFPLGLTFYGFKLTPKDVSSPDREPIQALKSLTIKINFWVFFYDFVVEGVVSQGSHFKIVYSSSLWRDIRYRPKKTSFSYPGNWTVKLNKISLATITDLLKFSLPGNNPLMNFKGLVNADATFKKSAPYEFRTMRGQVKFWITDLSIEPLPMNVKGQKLNRLAFENIRAHALLAKEEFSLLTPVDLNSNLGQVQLDGKISYVQKSGQQDSVPFYQLKFAGGSSMLFKLISVLFRCVTPKQDISVSGTWGQMTCED